VFSIMPELPFDFGTLISYFVPGFIVLAALTLAIPSVARLFGRLDTEHAGGAMLTLVVMALITGMLLSTARVGLLDCTTGIISIPGMSEDQPHFGPIERERPDYGKLTREGRLAALQEAQRNEMNPYLFYGNTFVAVLVFAAVRLFAVTRRWSHDVQRRWVREALLFLLLLFLAIMVLYPSYRAKYYQYTLAVRAINGA
jgi:hypothetical protein